MLITSNSLYSNQQIRDLEKIAEKQYAMPAEMLMQTAGASAFAVLEEHWPQAKEIIVFCGAGNNAGDGYVLAKLAHQQGLNVQVFYLQKPQALKGAALQAAEACLQAGVTAVPYQQQGLDEADVIVDALLGTGLSRDVDGEYQRAIGAMNKSDKLVLAIDTPSGLNVDTGQVQGIAVCADVTVTFVGLKQGLFTGQAKSYCGKVVCENLGLADAAFQQQACSAKLAHVSDFTSLLLPRKQHTHKGDFGHVLVVGGDYGMAGAARMAAMSAARVGAGLVSVATRPEHVGAFAAACPEIMAHGVTNAEDYQHLLKRATVIVLGPGLGKSEWSQQLWQAMIKSDLPLVVDADALNLLAEQPCRKPNWILTPHPGEAGRLLQQTTLHVQQDRFASAQALQDKFGGSVVLKGSGTLICSSTKHLHICAAGNPGMGTGGMGDVLSGVIGGLLAQKFDLDLAATLGVCLHAEAADIAAHDGERGMLATDLLPYLRKLMNLRQ